MQMKEKCIDFNNFSIVLIIICCSVNILIKDHRLHIGFLIPNVVALWEFFNANCKTFVVCKDIHKRIPH